MNIAQIATAIRATATGVLLGLSGIRLWEFVSEQLRASGATQMQIAAAVSVSEAIRELVEAVRQRS